MPIKLNSTGGGSVSIDVPSTASTFTLTAPARTGNMITSADSKTITSGMIGISGAILQVKSFNFLSTSYTSSSASTSFVDSGMFITFDNNLRDSSSKVLVFFDVYFGQTDASGAWAQPSFGTIFEGGVNRGDATYGLAFGNAVLGGGGANMQYDASSLNGSCLFTPSTITTPTIRFFYRSNNSGITTYINRLGNSNTAYYGSSNMTIMEIAG